VAVLKLAFDTATLWGRFALAEGNELLAYRPVNVSGSYADALLPVVDDLFHETGRELRELGAIGVTMGPGSFTGVRIGIATAKGLAYGLGIPLVAVSTLAAMAAALLAETSACEHAIPVLDARRGEVYAAVYRRAGCWVEPLNEPAVLPPDAWWEKIRLQVPDLEQLVWGGDGVALLVGQGKNLRPEMRTKGTPVLHHWSASHPATARALVLAMGDRTGPLSECHPFELRPLYLRASDAEIKKRLDLTPQEPDADFDSYHGPQPGKTS
jgi:tRNA threonylcarbamoyladenosine biosynthesis protein TsaB